MRAGRIAPRYELVGGKGGVGKTTCAAALAVRSAQRGLRTLVVSTDPAPSLGDALGIRLTSRPRRVPLSHSAAPLHAVEIDASRVMSQWLETRAAALQAVALRGTWLDDEDVSRLLSLSLPGIDEIAGLLEVSRLGGSGRYDSVVVDMAPTGHTLRMLTMPETLGGIANVFARMVDKYRAMMEALTGRWRPDPSDAQIDEMVLDSERLTAWLRDPAMTATTWVTLAERLAVAETADALRELAERGIPVHRLIVNRLVASRPGCSWCMSQRRAQLGALTELKHMQPSHTGCAVAWVPDRGAEPRGVRALGLLGRAIERPQGSAPRGASGPSGPSAGRRPSTPLAVSGAERLLMFGGKGGVGKTTCAAATAIAIADANPDRRVLLLSVDPAHSVADVLDVALDPRSSRVAGAPDNLRVRELDAARALAAIKTRYSTAVDALFDRARGASAFDAAHDRRIVQALVDLAPPGLDEIVATITVVEALEPAGQGRTADVVVIDTAPTGHALRLLEMPSLLHDWVKALMRTLLKYQAVAGLGDAGAVLLTLSQQIGALRRILTDPASTSFVVVTRAASLPRAETGRLLASLDRLSIPAPLVVVNAIGRGTCRTCRRAAAMERRELDAIRRMASTNRSGRQVATAPAQQPPPVGAQSLRRWRSRWTLAGTD